MENKKTLLWLVVALVVSTILVIVGQSIAIGRLRAENGRLQAVLDAFSTKVDTLYISDTITVSTPKEAAKPRPLHDTLYFPVTDSVLVERTDTLFLPLEREQREYGDSTYRAWVSGVEPRLDSILIFPKTMVITKPTPVVVKRRLDVGLQAGVGAVQPFKQEFDPKLGYYLGIGLQYNF